MAGWLGEAGWQAVALSLQVSLWATLLSLPFGVAVTKPISLQVDKRSLESRPFQTCIPQGCVVPVEFVGEAFKQLQRGSRLTVTTPVANGETASESLSLKGFSKAYDRAKELTKPL